MSSVETISPNLFYKFVMHIDFLIAQINVIYSYNNVYRYIHISDCILTTIK